MFGQIESKLQTVFNLCVLVLEKRNYVGKELSLKVYVFFLVVLSGVSFLVSCAGVSHQSSDNKVESLTPFPFEQRHVIAVLPFEFAGAQEQYGKFSRKLDEMMIVELFGTQRFRIVECTRIDAILQEISLGQTGITGGDMAYQVGQQTGADLVLVGTMGSVKAIYQRDSVGFAVSESRGFDISLQGRLIDVARGEVLAVGQATGTEIQKQKVAMGARTGVIAPEETLINKSLEKAVKGLFYELAKNVGPKGGIDKGK